jgi:hypothetical protein
VYKHRNYYRVVEKLLNRISAVNHTGLKVEKLPEEVKNPKELINYDQSSKRTKEEGKKIVDLRILMICVSYGRLFICCDIRNGVGSPT